MAIPVAGAPQTLGEVLGLSVEPKITYSMACDIAAGLKGGTTKLSKPEPFKSPVGAVKVLDLPAKFYDQAGIARHKVKHILDIIPDASADFDWEQVSGSMM